MASALSSRATYEPIRSIGWAAITNAYQIVGTAITEPVRILKIKNNTDADIMVSFDGVTDSDFFPASSGDVTDFTTNSANAADPLELPGRRLIYIKAVGALPTSGDLYIVVIYANSN